MQLRKFRRFISPDKHSYEALWLTKKKEKRELEGFFLLTKYHWIITRTVKNSGRLFGTAHRWGVKAPPSLRYATHILQ